MAISEGLFVPFSAELSAVRCCEPCWLSHSESLSEPLRNKGEGRLDQLLAAEITTMAMHEVCCSSISCCSAMTSPSSSSLCFSVFAKLEEARSLSVRDMMDLGQTPDTLTALLNEAGVGWSLGRVALRSCADHCRSVRNSLYDTQGASRCWRHFHWESRRTPQITEVPNLPNPEALPHWQDKESIRQASLSCPMTCERDA